MGLNGKAIVGFKQYLLKPQINRVFNENHILFKTSKYTYFTSVAIINI